MYFSLIFHLILHFGIPAGVAWFFFRKDFKKAFLIMAAANLIDLDHFLVSPVFVPGRCSVGFHLLHSYEISILYFLMICFPKTRLIGLGLLIHVLVDGLDCVV